VKDVLHIIDVKLVWKNHSYDLETLAFVVALKIFRVYLLDIRFIMVTDCNAIRSTANKKILTPEWFAYRPEDQTA
jgi:hypothetical protein